MKTIEEKIAEYYDLDEAKGTEEVQLKIMMLLYSSDYQEQEKQPYLQILTEL